MADSVTPPPSVDATPVDTFSAPTDAIDLDAVDLDAVDLDAVDLDAVERDLRDVETALARLADGTYWSDDDPAGDTELANGPAS